MTTQYQNRLRMEITQKADAVIAELPAFSGKFFNSLKTKGFSPRTVLQYAYDTKNFFDYLKAQPGFKLTHWQSCTASEVLDKLTFDDIQEYLNTLEYYTPSGTDEKRPSSPSSKARKISSLRSFYKFFFKTGEIKNNLADLMELPKIPDHTILVLNPSQIQRLLEAIESDEGLTDKEKVSRKLTRKRDFAIVTLLLGTGMRVSELVGVDLDDIDFYEASILITRKGGDQDQVYFGEQVEGALRDYIENERDLLKPSGKDKNALFVSLHHKRISTRSVEILVKKYTGRAGINLKISPHKLRSTFGTALYEETGDIYLVADALHHSSVETTRKHYAKMSRDHKREAARISDNLFQKKDL